MTPALRKSLPCPHCRGLGSGATEEARGGQRVERDWTCPECQSTGEARCDWCGKPGAETLLEGDRLHAACAAEYRQVNRLEAA